MNAQGEGIDLTVVVPVYNESENISSLYQRLRHVMVRMGLSCELIFINDGSTDDSLDALRKMAKSDDTVRYLDFSRNFGHQIAVMAGLDHSRGDSVVIIDADLQDPPELIEELYEKMQEGYDVVYARRRSRKGESLMKKLTARVFYRLLQAITSVTIPVDTGDFRIISRRVVNVLRQMPEQHKFLRGQISWVGFQQTSILYDRDERQGGATGYTYRKMIRFAIDGITSFSDFPLKLATLAGFVVSFFAFLYMIWTFIAKIVWPESHVQGWASLMVSILFLGGIQLISIGIIGEYISRLNLNVMNRPLYVVRESNIQ